MTQRCESCGKICYSEREANCIINDAKRGINIRRNGVRMKLRCRSKIIPRRKYYCRACGYWHLTHCKAEYKGVGYAEGRKG